MLNTTRSGPGAAFAAVMASRRDPGPLSTGVRTTKSAAEAKRPMQQIPRRTRSLRELRIGREISLPVAFANPFCRANFKNELQLRVRSIIRFVFAPLTAVLLPADNPDLRNSFLADFVDRASDAL